MHHHLGRDRDWSTIKRSNGRRQKFASTLTPFYVLVGWNRVQEEQKEDGTAKLKISGCIHHIKMLWESMEKQLNSSGQFSKDFELCLFFKRSRKTLQEKNIQPENFEDRIIFMSMFNDILLKTDDEHCISNAEKVKNYEKKFLPGHWTLPGPGSEKRWCGESHDQQGQWDRTANKMV